jgi:hypothetical protein
MCVVHVISPCLDEASFEAGDCSEVVCGLNSRQARGDAFNQLDSRHGRQTLASLGVRIAWVYLQHLVCVANSQILPMHDHTTAVALPQRPEDTLDDVEVPLPP